MDQRVQYSNSSRQRNYLLLCALLCEQLSARPIFLRADLAPHRQLAPHWALQDIVRVGQQRSLEKAGNHRESAGGRDNPPKKKKNERGERREKGRGPPQFAAFLTRKRRFVLNSPYTCTTTVCSPYLSRRLRVNALQKNGRKRKEKRSIRPRDSRESHSTGGVASLPQCLLDSS